MKLRLMEDLELEGQTVFMRLDLNAPLKDGRVASDARLLAAVPTIKMAIEMGAQVALASHLGRPKGRRNPDYSMEPVAVRLSELLGMEVVLAGDCVGDGVRGILRDQHQGGVVLLENLRFHKGETGNDTGFARDLARPFDVYINDAFGASHRKHASIVGMPESVGRSAAGPLVQREVAALSRLLGDGLERPFVAVIGGAKVSDKLGILRALVKRVDTICIGGAMAYTFLKAQSIGVGRSRTEDEKLHTAREILKNAEARGVEVLLPTDHVVADDFREDADRRVVGEAAIEDDWMGLDIGPATRNLYADKVMAAGSLLWNGPMGVFEWSRFAGGTNRVAEAASQCEGYTVVGGGDSVAALEAAGVTDTVDHVSTGGGASLEFIERGSLPGLEILLES